MRKYLLGFIAVAMAASLSAFTSVKKVSAGKAFTTRYWFSVDQSLVASGAISSTNASYMGTSTDDTPPSGSPSCSASNYYCLVYFTDAGKVTASGGGYVINGSQTPDLVISKKDN